MMAKMEKALGQEPSEKSLVWAGSAPAMEEAIDAVAGVLAKVYAGVPESEEDPDVIMFLQDARACQAVYQSGIVVSVAALQALVTRAVGLLG